MKTTTIGVFPNKMRAEQAINELRDAGVSDTDISCVYRDKEGEIKEIDLGNSSSSIYFYSVSTKEGKVFRGKVVKE